MKVYKELFDRWEKYSRLFCADYGTTTSKITSKVSAWNIANALSIPKEAYHLGMNDTHIETALKRIFPNAWEN
jgi:hypothetical protein